MVPTKFQIGMNVIILQLIKYVRRIQEKKVHVMSLKKQTQS